MVTDKPIAGFNGGARVLRAGDEMRLVQVVREQRDGIQLGELLHVSAGNVLVGFPFFKKVAGLSDGFNFDGNVFEVDSVPRQWTGA